MRALRSIAFACLVAVSPVAFGSALAETPGLADAYNHQTDSNFRIGMQMRLAWTGDYAGTFSGAIDAASLRAIRDFQARHGMEANGVISESFLKRLVAESDAAQASAGFELVADPATGTHLPLPLALVSDGGPTPIGHVWRSGGNAIEIETVRLTGIDQTLDAVHAMLAQPTETRSVTSEIRDANGFVVAGVEQGRPYVMRFKGVDGDVRGLGISYDEKAADAVRSYATVAINLFDPVIPENPAPELVSATGVSPFGMKAVDTSAQHRNRFAAAAAREKAAPSDADEKDAATSGSGFAVSSDGWVVTNAHVAGSCRRIMVGDKGFADKVVIDEENDLAAVHVNATFDQPLALADGAPRLGEDVLALGFPLRSILADSLNVTRGNVSSLRGLQNDPRYLQISAPVQPGNSGGPLVDLTGRVVGVVTAKLDAMAVADVTGDIPQSINFAIRPDAAAAFLRANGIAFRSAAASKSFGSVADTTEGVQASVMPVLCFGQPSS